MKQEVDKVKRDRGRQVVGGGCFTYYFEDHAKKLKLQALQKELAEASTKGKGGISLSLLYLALERKIFGFPNLSEDGGVATTAENRIIFIFFLLL